MLPPMSLAKKSLRASNADVAAKVACEKVATGITDDKVKAASEKVASERSQKRLIEVASEKVASEKVRFNT